MPRNRLHPGNERTKRQTASRRTIISNQKDRHRLRACRVASMGDTQLAAMELSPLRELQPARWRVYLHRFEATAFIDRIWRNADPIGTFAHDGRLEIPR
jgi:hypothetical protein